MIENDRQDVINGLRAELSVAMQRVEQLEAITIGALAESERKLAAAEKELRSIKAERFRSDREWEEADKITADLREERDQFRAMVDINKTIRVQQWEVDIALLEEFSRHHAAELFILTCANILRSHPPG